MNDQARETPDWTIALDQISPSENTVDSPEFREAMSRMAAAVTIISSNGSAGRAGFTATAVASVSDSPPTLLVCINRSSRSHEPLIVNGAFCANVLNASQAILADRFAGRMDAGAHDTVSHRFETGEWDAGVLGVPVLAHANVALECRISEVTQVSTHDIVLGQVVAIHLGDDASALVYRDRSFIGLK